MRLGKVSVLNPQVEAYDYATSKHRAVSCLHARLILNQDKPQSWGEGLQARRWSRVETLLCPLHIADKVWTPWLGNKAQPCLEALSTPHIVNLGGSRKRKWQALREPRTKMDRKVYTTPSGRPWSKRHRAPSHRCGEMGQKRRTPRLEIHIPLSCRPLYPKPINTKSVANCRGKPEKRTIISRRASLRRGTTA